MARVFFNDDELSRNLLMAIGEVVVTEAQLDAILVNALKRAYGITPTTAIEKSGREWRFFDQKKKALIKKFKQDFPDDESGLAELTGLLETAEDARNQRHAQVHSWAVVDADTEQPLRIFDGIHIGHDVEDAIRVRDTLRQVRNNLEVFTRTHYLNKT